MKRHIDHCPNCNNLVEFTKENFTLSKVDKKSICCSCLINSPAWVRCTQFSGDHYYCNSCANKQIDFMKEDPSYFYWRKVS